MNSEEVKALVSAESRAAVRFDNLHGITPENLASFLVEPYEGVVDPDDLETQPRAMWVVLHECRNPREGYVGVFDPQGGQLSWGVAELGTDSTATLVVGASSLSETLSDM